MEVIIDYEEGNFNGGLQMLLNRWRLQEEKLQAFEESLKDINNLMTYQRVQENLEEKIPKILMHETSSTLSNFDFNIGIHNKVMSTSPISSIISNEQDFDNNLNKETCTEGNINLPISTNDESMEEFEKRIWGGIWKDEAFLNDNIVKDDSCFVPKVVSTLLKNDVIRTNIEMIQLPIKKVLNDVKDNNVIDEDTNSKSNFQEKIQIPSIQVLVPISHDSLLELDLKEGQSNSIYTSFEDITKLKIDCLNKFKDFEDTKSLIKSKNYQLEGEKVESNDMVVNLESLESSSLLTFNGEYNSTNELSKQRITFAESIMATEAQRQVHRKKKQLCKNKALKSEVETVANMENVLKSQLQIEQEVKDAFIKQKEYLKQKKYEQEQKIEELQGELESSNISLKDLTENWKESKRNMIKDFNLDKFEEKRRNIAAKIITRAFKTKQSRVLNNCCIVIQKMVRGFFSRQRVQELKGQRCKVLKILNIAIEEGNLKTFIENFAEAQKVGIYKDLDRLKLAFAQRRTLHLCIYVETLQCAPSSNLIILLIEAKTMGLTKDKLKELLKSTTKIRRAAIEHLSKVATLGSWIEYQSSLKKALALGLEEEVDSVQKQWTAARANVTNWFQQVKSLWEIGRHVVFEKIKEAHRLGLATLVESIQATMVENENKVLIGLKTSVMTGTLKCFYEWMQLAKLFDMKEVIQKYSMCFKKKVAEVKKQLMQVTVQNHEKKNTNLLLNGLNLGLRTEVVVVVQHLRQRILMFVKEMINHILQSIYKRGIFIQRWNELQLQGTNFGIQAYVLKNMLLSIEKNVVLEHTRIKRSIVAIFKSDFVGFPIDCVYEKQRFLIRIRELTLEYFASNIKICELAFQNSKVRNKDCKFWRFHCFYTYSISWCAVDKLRSQWKFQYCQPNFEVLASKSSIETLRFLKHQQKNINVNELRHQSNTYCIRSSRYVGIANEIDEYLDDTNGADTDNNYWHIPCPYSRAIHSFSFNTLTRNILESSAHCNQIELQGISKLNITYKDLTSLGVGILGQWCPKLQIFMIDENKLSTLKGAFHGCERSLEYVLVKNNMLNDFKGLESLHNLKVLFLEGNFISYIGPSTELQTNLEDINVVKPKTSKQNCSSTSPHGSCRSWQGTSRFVEEKSEIASRGCLTSRNINNQYARSLWPKLKKLSLNNNRVAWIWELGDLCPNLEVLDLGCNELITLGGCEGRGLVGLKNLRLLDVGQNKLKGRSLWKALNHCPLLVSLVASRNRLTKLPTHFGSILLREIWLNGNSIKCLGCKAWLPNLQRFYLQDNLIENLESLLGCPSLEVLDISFNNIVDLSQLSHLASFLRLRTLQLNDNPLSNEEEHVEKVLEAVPWLIELDNDHIKDRYRKKSVQSIFLKNMAVIGIQYLYERLAQADKPFLSFKNPKYIEKQWISKSNDQYSLTSSTFINQWSNTKPKAMNRDIIEIVNGKTNMVVLWAIIFEFHQIANINPIIKFQYFFAMEYNLRPLMCLPCYSKIEENWNCLAFQEMFEINRKCHTWSKETNLRKEFLVQEGKFGSQTIEKGVKFSKEVITESYNVDQYFLEHLEYTNNNYKDLYKENAEYKTETKDRLLYIKHFQALIKSMLARKNYMRMQRLAVDVFMAQEAQQFSEKQIFESSVIQIQNAWRKWILNRYERSAIKLQAFWRGLFIRKRFRQALLRMQYIDEDDFEYIAIDENEFVLDPIVFEDNFTPSRFQCLDETNNESVSKTILNSKNAIDTIESLKDQEPIICESTKHLIQEDHKCEIEVGHQSSNLKDKKNIKFLSENYKQPQKDISKILMQLNIQQSKIEPNSKIKAQFCGKDLQAEKKKAAIAEIAKDWGFKDKKTAEAYMKAQAKIMKRVEKEKAIQQGAQSRFDLFKARSEEMSTHLPPHYIHTKQTIQLPCKVEKELVFIPSEDIRMVEGTYESWNPPALPTLIPHVKQQHFKKGKLRKDCLA